MSKVFWIDKKGNEISIPSISSHIGLAEYFLKKSPALIFKMQLILGGYNVK